MQNQFKRIGLFAKPNSKAVAATLEKLIAFLSKQNFDLTIEQQSAVLLSPHNIRSVPREELGKGMDLVIVVGGDGSFLNAARAVVPYEVPMVGVNRGRLGFLADILPNDLEKDLTEILSGVYREERRALLSARVERNGITLAEGTALNDIVLYSGTLARMVEFEVYINDQFVQRQRADGLITSTPTGSTAYALSGGGPILYPTIEALVLVAMLPHMLTSRPIVVENKNSINLVITANNDVLPKLSCDGQLHFDLMPKDVIHIQKHPQALILIHPKQHDYFAVLREKLGWSTSQIKDT